jgi:hypothetical protein
MKVGHGHRCGGEALPQVQLISRGGKAVGAT